MSNTNDLFVPPSLPNHNSNKQHRNHMMTTHNSHYHTNDNSANQIVLMIYNLSSSRLNCDRLFNLFCLYGNVDRVRNI